MTFAMERGGRARWRELLKWASQLLDQDIQSLSQVQGPMLALFRWISYIKSLESLITLCPGPRSSRAAPCIS
jgi:hypothetical protein